MSGSVGLHDIWRSGFPFDVFCNHDLHPAVPELSSAEIERLYPARVPLIARGALSRGDKDRIVEEACRIDEDRRCGSFNGIDTFHFRQLEQGAAMADFLLRNRMHRLVPGSSQAAAPAEVAAEWVRMAQERAAILAWGRASNMLRDVVQEYRFERRSGSDSFIAHRVAASLIEKRHPSIGDPLNHAGVCIEWAEREHRQWFWRCCRHQVL
jgi:hypothetical protein